MVKLLIFLAACLLRLPNVDTFRTIDWKPEFTEPADVRIVESTVGFFTHSSTLFDPLRATAPAVDAVASQLKSKSFPRLYLHDKYNPSNPAWTYLYSDWNPTAYVGSDVGHIDINLSQVDHVVCVGGFFEQCERSTVSDVVKLWYRSGYCHDLRITQVTDGVFSVLSLVNSADRFDSRVRAAHRQKMTQNRKAIITLAQALDQILDEELYPDFLRRQLPSFPVDVNVVFDIYGVIHPIQVLSEKFPTLTFAYRTSDRFLEFKTPELDFERAWQEWRDSQRKRIRRYPSSRSPIASGRVIYSQSGVPTRVYSPPVTGASSFGSSSFRQPISTGTIYPAGNVLPSGTIIQNNSYPSGSYVSPPSEIIYSDQ